MKIYVKGRSGKISLGETRTAVRFFCSLLMSKRLYNKLKLNICFDELDDSDDGGDCIWEDDNIRPKEFTLTINKHRGRRGQLIALAHELVHVKQYARGEMIDLMSAKLISHVKFRGKRFLSNDDTYWEDPWEIEAYGREIGLYERYKHHIKSK